MPDLLLSTDDYTDIRAAVAETFADTARVYSVNYVDDGEGGTTRTETLQGTYPCLLMELSGNELIRAQQVASEATVKVHLAALTPMNADYRITVANHETLVERDLEVEYVYRPSREFVRQVLCKDLSP